MCPSFLVSVTLNSDISSCGLAHDLTLLRFLFWLVHRFFLPSSQLPSQPYSLPLYLPPLLKPRLDLSSQNLKSRPPEALFRDLPVPVDEDQGQGVRWRRQEYLSTHFFKISTRSFTRPPFGITTYNEKG